MSIAIYRHWKLYVAVPIKKPDSATILNFYPRRIRDVRFENGPDRSPVVKVKFTYIDRRRELLTHHNEIWQFDINGFSIITELRRNDRLVRSFTREIPPAYHTVWTDSGYQQRVCEAIEQELATQVVIEQYLHRHVPNPYDYRIIVFDFDPKKQVAGRPEHYQYLVRPLEEVEVMAPLDHSEDSEQWAALFLD